MEPAHSALGFIQDGGESKSATCARQNLQQTKQPLLEFA
jgi:hypothetical protein